MNGDGGTNYEDWERQQRDLRTLLQGVIAGHLMKPESDLSVLEADAEQGVLIVKVPWTDDVHYRVTVEIISVKRSDEE